MSKKAQKSNTFDLFTSSIKEIYGDKSSPILSAMKIITPTTFRINKSKGKTEEEILSSLESYGYKIKKADLPNSYVFTLEPEKQHLSDTIPFLNGEIYSQELSSMLPPILLDPKEEEYILDISAAPGSKTTQIADLTNNNAKILAIEKHPIRIKILEHNIELQGSKKIKVILGDGIKFDKRNSEFVNFFNKVLVDAPCSGEGSFNLNNAKSYKYWNIHKREDMSKIQKGLLIAGFRMLKPGGTLIYSTCTFGVEENEMVLDWFLEKLQSEAKIEKITLELRNTMQGKTFWKGKKLNPQISNSIRILPNGLFTGFFVAKIKKT